jgi:hypothetical protein
MNWGHKITIVIVAFIAAMLSMVFIASKQSNEMYDGNYYEKELKYQKFIDAANNLKATNTNLEIKQSAENIVFTIPSTISDNITNGSIELLKADDSKKDVIQKITTSTNTQSISKKKLSNGLYITRIFWENNNTPYYFEQKVNITK